MTLKAQLLLLQQAEMDTSSNLLHTMLLPKTLQGLYGPRAVHRGDLSTLATPKAEQVSWKPVPTLHLQTAKLNGQKKGKSSTALWENCFNRER